jgi:hypothetical protein
MLLGPLSSTMYTGIFQFLSPGVYRQGFTASIIAWVESPRSHLFLVPMIQQKSFVHVNTHVDLIGQFKDIPWGVTHSSLVSFFCIASPLLYILSKLTATTEWTHPPKYGRHSGLVPIRTC